MEVKCPPSVLHLFPSSQLSNDKYEFVSSSLSLVFSVLTEPARCQFCIGSAGLATVTNCSWLFTPSSVSLYETLMAGGGLVWSLHC